MYDVLYTKMELTQITIDDEVIGSNTPTTISSTLSHDNSTSEVAAIAHDHIVRLVEMHKNDPYRLEKIGLFFSTQLVPHFDKIKRARQQVLLYQWQREEAREQFADYFMQTTQYYYIAVSEIYIQYGSNSIVQGLSTDATTELTMQFTPVASEQIHRDICASMLVNDQCELLSGVNRVGTIRYIMHKIRMRSIANACPYNKSTIQPILHMLVPSCFPTETDAIFFLTIVGDHLLGKSKAPQCKEPTVVLYVSANDKVNVSWLSETASSRWFGVGFNSSFRTHPTKKEGEFPCLVRMTRTQFIQNPFQRLSHIQLFNVCCVACHYSTRYNSAYAYITSRGTDCVASTYITSMVTGTAEQLYREFENEYFEVNKIPTRNITRKNVMFLWKQFLETRQIPAFAFAKDIRAVLNALPFYVPATDDFAVSSHQYSTTHHFNNFWNEHTIQCIESSGIAVCEVAIEFRKWMHVVHCKEFTDWNDKHVHSAICYYYPNIEFNDNCTFIYGVNWTKC